MFAILAKVPLLSQAATLAPSIKMLDGIDGHQVSATDAVQMSLLWREVVRDLRARKPVGRIC